MRGLGGITTFAVAVAAAGCGASGVNDAAPEVADPLIGGQVLSAAALSSVVSFDIAWTSEPGIPTDGTTLSFCTGTRVGKRLLLTAAHCLNGAPATPPVQLHWGAGHDAPWARAARALQHPAYAKCMRERGQARLCDQQNDAPDLALIELPADMDASIGISKVDTTRVQLGETVHIAGAGLEAAGGVGVRRSGLSYRALYAWLAAQRAHQPSDLQTVQSSKTDESQKANLFPGLRFGANTAFAETDEGDSGGPTFRVSQADYAIVGVHMSGTPGMYQKDARLDLADPAQGWRWLKDNGVPMVASASEPPRVCAAFQDFDVTLGMCVDADGWVPRVRLEPRGQALCQADKALPRHVDRPMRMDWVSDCAQVGLPVTLVHHWSIYSGLSANLRPARAAVAP